MKKIICKTEKETEKLAVKLARQLKGGQIIALEGELGAGKTTFTQYLAKSLGIKKQITSPTFVLMKVYPVNNSKSMINNFIHVDCYRLDDPQELFYLGIEEYLNNDSSVVVIEWADKIKPYLKKFKNIIWLKLDTKNHDHIFRGNILDKI